MGAKLKRLLSILTVASAIAAPVHSAELPDPLVVATEGAYPPYNYVDSDGKVEGFEIDLAKEMCAELDITCEFVVQDWDGLIPGLLARKYDAIIGSLYITEARKERIAFSEKYYQVPTRFAVPKDSDITISDEGLADVTVGTQRGASFERMMRDKFSHVDLQVYATMEEVYQDLRSGRVDAVVGDVVSMSENLIGGPEGDRFELRGPEFTDPQWFGYGAGVGVRKADAHIADQFTKAIEALREDGRYEAIAEEWFGFDVYGS